ncbi:MAG: dTMP kinase [Hyphomicrobiaceae bacterium]
MAALRRGRLITLEGGEGTGKSTQTRLLAERLHGLGHEVVTTREPGGSPFAEQVRAFIIAASTAPHAPMAEALLFLAARADHLAQRIRPALERGAFVICDRFTDSTLVYQGLAGGVPPATLEALDRLVVGDDHPDLTLVLDLDPVEGLARALTRSGGKQLDDRYESREIDYHRRLREGFLTIARSEPARCVVVDASESEPRVASAIWSAVSERLAGAWV